MRAAAKRGLRAAATNLRVPKNDQVEFLLEGENVAIEEIIHFMRSGAPLNNWGAKVDRLEELTSGMAFEEHRVTTANVDDFKWNPNVEFFI